MVKNLQFIRLQEALSYLKRKEKINQQKLAELMGTSQTTISRNIKLANEGNLNEDFVINMNNSVGNIFNLDYIINGHGELFRQKESQATEPKSHAEPLSLQDGVESLLTLASQLIKENESLRRDLQESIREVHALADHLQNIHIPRQYITSKTEVLKAADSEEELKK